MSTVEEFVQATKILSADDRLHLIDALWDTIPSEKWPQPSSDELALVQRRSQEFDNGDVVAVHWPEAQARLRARIIQTHG